MQTMLWGAITTGYQAISSLAKAMQGLIHRQAPMNDQDFADNEVDNYEETPAGRQQALREDMAYNLVKGVLYGYNTYRLLTQEPDLLSFGVSCISAIETAKEVYDAARNENATSVRRR